MSIFAVYLKGLFIDYKHVLLRSVWSINSSSIKCLIKEKQNEETPKNYYMKAEYSILNARIMRKFVSYLFSYDLELRFFNLNDVILY
jgi:hypothetical protein